MNNKRGSRLQRPALCITLEFRLIRGASNRTGIPLSIGIFQRRTVLDQY
jgi:hypothetical protein